MQRLRSVVDRPRSTYAVLAPALVVCWLVSGIGGGDGGGSTPSDGATYYVGAAGWVLFCLVLLTTAIYTIAVVLRRLRRSTT